MRTASLVWTAWAIHLGKERLVSGAHPFAGPYLLERRFPRPWQTGFPVALFRTKREAREVLVRVKRKDPKARIVPVNVRLNWTALPVDEPLLQAGAVLRRKDEGR
ncbi:MAG: hypothetical protein QOD74_1685 [Variibacter sp.]|jgi:hypothetical protein|nr:hypothetical protein [Variibacter sp.]